MVELLKFEYYRLIKSKMVWIILGVMAFLPVLPVILFSILVVNIIQVLRTHLSLQLILCLQQQMRVSIVAGLIISILRRQVTN